MRVAKTAAKAITVATGVSCGYITYRYLSPDPYRSETHTLQSTATQLLSNGMMKGLGAYALKAFDKDAAVAAEVNDKLLVKLLRQNENTAYGVDHGLARMQTSEDFRQMHPLTRHEHYES